MITTLLYSTPGVTILLAFFVNSLVVSNYTPEASNELPVIGFYYMFNIGLVSVSVATAVCVLNFHFRGHRVSRVPNWMKTFLRMKNKLYDYSELIDHNSEYLKKMKLIKTNINNCIYTNEMLQNHRDFREIDALASSYYSLSEANNLNKIQPITKDTFRKAETLTPTGRIKKSIEMNIKKSVNHENLERMLRLIKKTVKLIDRNNTRLRNNQHIHDEWKEVASKLDFIFFIIASVFVILAPIILFGKLYFKNEVIDHSLSKDGCGCGPH